MNCPVCNRNHTADLSICPSCGAMMSDSVREELIGKVSARLKSPNLETKEIQMPNKPLPSAKPIIPSIIINETPESVPSDTDVEPTSSTLVEFHSKNAAVPEWRLQLQNAVRQRQGQNKTLSQIEELPAAPRAKLVTNGANAFKAEAVETAKPAFSKSPDLARALERIEKSRQRFLVTDPASAPAPVPPKTSRNFPFYIAAKTSETDIKTAVGVNAAVGTFTKPKLAPPAAVVNEKLDTNKLPPLQKVLRDSPNLIEQTAAVGTVVETIKSPVAAVSETKITNFENSEVIEVSEVEDFDTCPTFAMRFNAGLFDLIIGSFVSLCLLAPFMLMGGEWLSGAGLFAFAATCAIVMFLYLTTAIGLYGTTFGMRLFSLELVDIEGEEYPTFHQAAVSSSVYLLSLAFAGMGFLTVFFNEDKRAVHDLVSKTIVVKE